MLKFVKIALLIFFVILTIIAFRENCRVRTITTPQSVEADSQAVAPQQVTPKGKTIPDLRGVEPDMVGMASFYGRYFSGMQTANGERFHPDSLTAAHRTYPFGTWVVVRHVSNQRQVLVRINDRGPASAERIIDVSRRAAKELGLIETGVGKVELYVLKRGVP